MSTKLIAVGIQCALLLISIIVMGLLSGSVGYGRQVERCIHGSPYLTLDEQSYYFRLQNRRSELRKELQLSLI